MEDSDKYQIETDYLKIADGNNTYWYYGKGFLVIFDKESGIQREVRDVELLRFVRGFYRIKAYYIARRYYLRLIGWILDRVL